MSRDPARAATQFFGGRVRLDFANTLDWRTSDDPVELIPDYASFLSWSERRDTLPAAAIARLRVHGAKRKTDTEAVMRETYKLRAQIWEAADALRNRETVDLDAFNQALSKLPPQPNLASTDRRTSLTSTEPIFISRYGPFSGH